MKIRHLPYVLIACTVVLISCPSTVSDIPVIEVTVDPSSVSLPVGDSQALTVTVSPANATNQAVSWSSDDETVATVGAGNMLSAVGVGTTVVTVTTDDGDFTDTCDVTVTAATVDVTGVEVEPESVSLEVGDSQALTVTVSPANATNQAVSWSSDDETVATLGAGNMLSAVGVGTTVVTVTTDDGGFTDTCDVTVTAATVDVTGVEVDPSSVSLEEGETQQLTAAVSPANATDQGVSWSSDAEGVATVSASGLVTAVSEGTATITVTTDDGGFTDTCDVEVSAPVVAVAGVSVDPSSASLEEGETQQLTATVSPANATDQGVSWSSDAEGVATVSASGLVTAVSEGTATITVTTDDGGFTDTCDVEVTATPSLIYFYEMPDSMTANQTLILKRRPDTVPPYDLPGIGFDLALPSSTVYYIDSDDEDIAEVVPYLTWDLLITKEAGTVELTVVTANNLHSDTHQLTVTSDNVPPTLGGVDSYYVPYGDNKLFFLTDSQICLQFSEFVDEASAENEDNYTVDIGGTDTELFEAARHPDDPTFVTLTLTGTTLSPGTTVTITVADIEDTVGNVMTTDSVSETYTAPREWGTGGFYQFDGYLMGSSGFVDTTGGLSPQYVKVVALEQGDEFALGNVIATAAVLSNGSTDEALNRRERIYAFPAGKYELLIIDLENSTVSARRTVTIH